MYLDAVNLVRTAFLVAAVTGFITYIIPAFRSRFLDYGPRSHPIAQTSAEREKVAVKQRAVSVLDSLAEIKVPHSWFTSFYAVSVTLSLAWMIALPLARPYLQSSFAFLDLGRASTAFSKTKLACFLMLCQGVRRLAECVLLAEPSKSTMWIGHWLVGILFYLGMSVAIWIEGVPALLKHEFSIHDLEIALPDARAALCLLFFLFASGIQHDCHSYLASLKKKHTSPKTNETNYQFPTFPAFNLCLTPHYFMECVIYLVLAVLAAPVGYLVNWTLVCAFIFVVTNLGITAMGTRKWYARKFGSAAIKGRWTMIPLVF